MMRTSASINLPAGWAGASGGEGRTQARQAAAASVLAGAQTRYASAKLGAVTAIHPAAGTGGLSFLVDQGEQRFLLSKADLQTLWSLLGDFLNDQYRTNSQSLRLSDGAKSEVFSPDEVLK